MKTQYIFLIITTDACRGMKGMLLVLTPLKTGSVAETFFLPLTIWVDLSQLHNLFELWFPLA